MAVELRECVARGGMASGSPCCHQRRKRERRQAMAGTCHWLHVLKLLHAGGLVACLCVLAHKSRAESCAPET